MDTKKISSLVDYDDEDEHQNETQNKDNSEKLNEKSVDTKEVSVISRQSKHGSRSDRNDRETDRRHDKRSKRESEDRNRRKDEHRKDGHRRDDRNRRRRSRSHSPARSRSRSRERHSHRSGSRRDDSRYKHRTNNEKVVNESKPTVRTQNINTMQLMHEQIKAKTGVEIPKYYNPGVVNPIKFAQQEQKRKLLWSKPSDQKEEEKKDISTSGMNLWNNLKFEGDKGSQMTEKFRKLMGIKESNCSASTSRDTKDANSLESQETLFRNLNTQYEIARMSTHTQRGVGLGFGTFQSTSNTSESTATSGDHN